MGSTPPDYRRLRKSFMEVLCALAELGGEASFSEIQDRLGRVSNSTLSYRLRALQDYEPPS